MLTRRVKMYPRIAVAILIVSNATLVPLISDIMIEDIHYILSYVKEPTHHKIDNIPAFGRYQWLLWIAYPDQPTTNHLLSKNSLSLRMALPRWLYSC